MNINVQGVSMQRRRFLNLGIGMSTGFLLAGHNAFAYDRCIPAANQWGEACECGISLPNIQECYNFQELSQWCWAASVSMIFAFYGHRVSQRTIVKAVYGAEVNLPALTGQMISSQLSHVWTDDDDSEFNVEIEGLYDFDAGITGLTDEMILSALTSERPLILGTRNHAMVLVSAAYVPVPNSPRIFNIGLADPLPNMGLRGAQNEAELLPMHRGGDIRYLALPLIS